MTDLPQHLADFQEYVNAWNALSYQYDHTPDWRFIKKTRLLNRMTRLTREFETKQKERGFYE